MEPLGSTGAALQPQEETVDFDESDESIEQEDELDAVLSRLLIDKLSIFNFQLFAGTEKS